MRRLLPFLCFGLIATGSAFAQSPAFGEFGINSDGSLLSGKFVQTDADTLSVEFDGSESKPGACVSVFGTGSDSTVIGWLGYCDSIGKDGPGRFSGQLIRDVWATVPTFNGDVVRDDTGKTLNISVVLRDNCPAFIGAPNNDNADYEYVATTICNYVPASGQAAENDPASEPFELPITYTRDHSTINGWATRQSSSRYAIDLKFDTNNINLCRSDLGPGSEAEDFGWQRLCRTAARFGQVRLAGEVRADRGSLDDGYFRGSLQGSDPAFLVDVEMRITTRCVIELGLRGTGNTYAMRNLDCAVNADPDDIADALNNFFGGGTGGGGTGGGGGGGGGGAAGSGGNQILPSGNVQQANNNPVAGTDQDLWPQAGRGLFAKFCHNGDSREDCESDEAAWQANIRLERSQPGAEQISFSNYRTCANFSTSEFCALAQVLNGRSVAISNYGFDGERGVGYFEHNDRVWVLTLQNDSGDLRIDLAPTIPAIETPLSVNANSSNPADATGSFAFDDFWPVPGFGHLATFIDNRMPVPGRPNLTLPSGDIVLATGSADVPNLEGRSRNAGAERIYMRDFGQCPSGVDTQLCQTLQANVNRSFVIENYRSNGKIGNGEALIGSARYWIVLSLSDEGKALNARLLRIANPQNDVFSSFLVGIVTKDNENKGGGNPSVAGNTCEPSWLTQQNGNTPNFLTFEKPTDFQGRRFANSTQLGVSVKDNKDMALAVCEIQYQKLVALGEARQGNPALAYQNVCVFEGSKGAGAQFKMPANHADDPLGFYRNLHHNIASNPSNADAAYYIRGCDDCELIETIMCEHYEQDRM